jgi:hypothetical protein
MSDSPGPSYYQGEDGGLSAGDITGIVIGVTFGIPLLMAVCWGFLICYRRKIAPITSGKARPESNKEVAERIKRDFGTGDDTATAEEEQKEVVAIEMVEPVTVVQSTTTTTTTTANTATTPSTGLSPLDASNTTDTSPDSVHSEEAANPV